MRSRSELSDSTLDIRVSSLASSSFCSWIRSDALPSPLLDTTISMPPTNRVFTTTHLPSGVGTWRQQLQQAKHNERRTISYGVFSLSLTDMSLAFSSQSCHHHHHHHHHHLKPRIFSGCIALHRIAFLSSLHAMSCHAIPHAPCFFPFSLLSQSSSGERRECGTGAIIIIYIVTNLFSITHSNLGIFGIFCLFFIL